ncbi:MAG: DUF3267 domain-containing protein [Bacillota bacterium]|nr:DUF3267 domain-containing protein [Bacillota bacterium]
MAKNNPTERSQRVKDHEALCARMKKSGWEAIDGTISVAKANAMAFVTAGPFALLFYILYFWHHHGIWFNMNGMIWFLALFLVSIPIHEGIHGLTWGFFCKGRWRSVGFGMMWKYLTPYCHCKEPLGFWGYFCGCIMPFLVLGIGISLFGLIGGNGVFMALGLCSILAAGGDTTILWYVIKCRVQNGKKLLFVDHPNQCGFIAFQPPKHNEIPNI